MVINNKSKKVRWHVHADHQKHLEQASKVDELKHYIINDLILHVMKKYTSFLATYWIGKLSFIAMYKSMSI